MAWRASGVSGRGFSIRASARSSSRSSAAPSGQQGPVQLKTGVLGRGPDQGDDALFNEGQEAVLLGPVEAVDFVNEQKGLLARAATHTGGLESLLQVSHAREDRADRLVFIARRPGQQAGYGRLAGAGRTPQDHGAEAPRLDHAADRAALTQ